MSTMTYQKIPGPFRRDPETNKVVHGLWATEELAALGGTDIWVFSEKVDGMNMRAIWDGHNVTFGGRTDRAQIPGDLLVEMERIFTEEKFEQAFGESPVVVFGEGYGAGIQKGGHYRDDKGFVGFDVAVNGDYLSVWDARDVIQSCFGADVTPLWGRDISIWDAVDFAEREGFRSSRWPDAPMEGVVGVTQTGLRDRRGGRIAVKVKAVDFCG